MAHFLSALIDGPYRRWALENLRTGRTVATTVETAFDSASRRRGLLGRDGLAPGTVLVLAPCSAVHTFFMRFPIDVVFVRRDGTVAAVRAEMRAWRMAAGRGAFATLEFAAGGAAGAIVPGDRLAFVETRSGPDGSRSGPDQTTFFS
jgi:uncharacterized membrane protein (UPF0127 family)